MTDAIKINDEHNFETALQKLEEIVHQLEQGNVPLDKSIDLYEQGEKLRLLCQKRLDHARARIDKIMLDKDKQPASVQSFDED
ncbi:exodeoxyribonuclease VII small subunit [Sphingorhabdus lutea]|uniref:Exodeoxyribonuclease 7 small subunit n=1 Tax=Sphingorhabdus lutea TaxID=1913578 RepID=A0A1L3J9B0_9SPHN|nr:exodeoxyribonuclease VII small subunit [Sphingorhabdus lutea]APG61708.1 exodeoxyribonuclease VII small subunit [Sphingorhabdus lutea]